MDFTSDRAVEVLQRNGVPKPCPLTSSVRYGLPPARNRDDLHRNRDHPNDASIIRLVGAIMLEQNDEWSLNRRYRQRACRRFAILFPLGCPLWLAEYRASQLFRAVDLHHALGHDRYERVANAKTGVDAKAGYWSRRTRRFGDGVRSVTQQNGAVRRHRC